jgi:acetylornithine deacetylase
MSPLVSNSIQPAVDLLKSLVGFPSVSPTSNQAISDFIGGQLASLGFIVERTSYEDAQGVTKVNLVAHRASQRNSTSTKSGVAYFCHTDVVPADGWTGPGGDPFVATIADGKLYGRGTCDMKGSLVAMMSAAARVSADEQTAPLWIVCTADEEVGFHGAKYLVAHSPAFRQIVQAQPLAIIGEPTRLAVVHAHSSTTEGVNANEAMVPMLQTLLELNQRTRLEAQYQDHRFDPPTLSWNFGVSDGCSAVNITPETSTAWVTLRPMPNIDGADLVATAIKRAESLGLEWEEFEGGKPFWNEPTADCIRELCELVGGSPQTVCYGTDGGEFTELKNRVVWGPGDIAQAHTTDEWLDLQQLQHGIDLYTRAIRHWCTS